MAQPTNDRGRKTAPRDFSALQRVIQQQSNKKRIPFSTSSYSRFGPGYSSGRVADDFSLCEIQSIIRSGDIESLRELSRYYYRVNSSYREAIDFLANMPLYDTVIIPVFEEGKGSKTQIIKAFYNACTFLDNLDLPNNLARITREWLKTGIYYGIIQIDGDRATIQDLPIEYCRTRFKDFNNLNILEFNLLYFQHIHDENFRAEALATFPQEIQDAWRSWVNGKLESPWVTLLPGAGGICFTFVGDSTPPFISSIPDLKKMEDATDRESERDENELYKLLIQQMPIDSNGELVFQMEEIAQIHSSVASMLQDMNTVDVLTTLGDTSLESLQDSTAASQSNDRLEKYRKNVWNSLGQGEILFNPEGSSSLAYNIKKNESLLINYLNAYETWIKFIINQQYARPNLTFDLEILPTTVFNRTELQNNYFKSAQYGYSKMFAGVAMGIKQRSQLSLMNFENDFLEMSTKMIPLQSSYTTSGEAVAAEGSNTSKSSDDEGPAELTSKVGRPQLSDTEVSEKTLANRESQDKN